MRFQRRSNSPVPLWPSRSSAWRTTSVSLADHVRQGSPVPDHEAAPGVNWTMGQFGAAGLPSAGPRAKPPGPMSPRRSTTKRLAYAGLASGLALFTALIAWEGVREVARTLASAGMGLVWVTLFHLAPLAASALGWYALFGTTTRPPFRTFAWARWIAESINQLLPALHVGGNIVRAPLLTRRGVPR